MGDEHWLWQSSKKVLNCLCIHWSYINILPNSLLREALCNDIPVATSILSTQTLVSTYYCLLNTSDMADSWIESGKYKMSLECLVVIESKKKKKKKKLPQKGEVDNCQKDKGATWKIPVVKATKNVSNKIDNVVWACMLSRFSGIQLFATLWTVAHQSSLSMGFSRQGYWSGLPCPGTKPKSPASPVDSLPLSHGGKPR